VPAAPETAGPKAPGDRPIARIGLLAKTEYVAPAVHFVRDVAGVAGLGAADVDALAEAVRLVATNVVLHGFDPGEEGAFDVVIRRLPGTVVVAVEDQGLPFDFRSLADASGSVLGQLARKGLIDSVHVANLGVHGNRVEIVKRLPARTARPAEAPQPAGPPPAAPADTPLTIRMMTPEDAEAVARCTYRTYGYTAPDEKLYDPDHLRELLESGLYEVCLAVTPDGEVAGFLDLELDRPDGRVANSGEGMVDPRFRGHALFERLKRFSKDHATAKGLLGVYAEAVTVHPFSQKGEIAVGAHETGIQLGDEAPRVVFKDMPGSAPQKRTATVLYYLKANDGPARVVYPPARHRDVIRRIYERGALPRDLDAGAAPAVVPASARIKIDVFPDWSEASLTVSAYGRDLPELVRTHLRELCVRRIDWIGLDLPLHEPGADQFCPALEALGFFFAGVIPELSGGDVLRFQYLNDVEPDLDPQIASDFGRELFRYVVSTRPT
jgi:anti-sigma regulatory factor (Ser/Thr protein kinase)